MAADIDVVLKLTGILLGSSLLGVFITNALKRELKHKELIAGATRSALRRAEMYYRVRRRTNDPADLRAIRDEFHDIQQENDYYQALLSIESKWHGDRYGLLITAIEQVSGTKIAAAWRLRQHGPNIQISASDCPQVNKYAKQFAKDSRLLLNPFGRIWMSFRDSALIKKIFPIGAYDVH